MKPNLLLLLALLVATASVAQSQTDDSSSGYKRSYYAYYGWGFGGQKNAGTFGITAQVGERSTVGIVAHNTYKDPDYGYYGIDYSEEKQIVSGSFSALYGRLKKLPWGHLSLQAGPSYVTITRYEEEHWTGDYSGEEDEGFGLLVQGTVLPAYKFVGIGATVFVNVNSVFTHAGITFNAVLGRINYKKKG